jgi:hypothetical protein
VPRISTCGKGKLFTYEGDLENGIVIEYSTGPSIKISSRFLKEAIAHFKGKEVKGGFLVDNPPHGGFGEWVKNNSRKFNNNKPLTPAHGSRIAAILAHMGCLRCRTEGKEGVILRFIGHPASDDNKQIPTQHKEEAVSGDKERAVASEKLWTNLDIAFENFRSYVRRKSDPDALTLIDLLHVSNFKGGNASITDPEAQVNERLLVYADVLRNIRQKIGNKSLGELTEEEKAWFKDKAQKFIGLSLSEGTKIRGFGASYASALLAAHLPNLAPILDRNVLIGAGIVNVSQLQNDQIKEIETYYSKLIDEFHRLLASAGPNEPNQSLRNIDKRLFNDGRKVRRLQRSGETG